MRVLLNVPLSPYSGYGNDGIGLARAFMRWGADVYLSPSVVQAPLPADVAALLTKRLVAPFDLIINHHDPAQLVSTETQRASTDTLVAWTMWEYSNFGNLPGRSKLKKNLKNFDALIGYDDVSSDCLREYAAKDQKVLTIQGGFWPEDWPVAEGRDWHEKSKTDDSTRFGFCMVGQLHDRKDPFVAIQAFQELKNDPNIEFEGAELHLKGQPYDARIMTPHGWVSMGDLTVGSVVSNPDGGSQMVMGIQELGERDIYTVTFSDGTRVECTEDHLWDVSAHKRDWKTMSLQAIMKTNLRSGKHLVYDVPLTQPVSYTQPDSPLPIDPYLLGLLIGDGSLTKQVRLWSADEEILDSAVNLLPEHATPGARTEGRGVVGLTLRGLQPDMRALGLMEKRSYEKTIPERYLYATSSDRLSLLQGLMDTDGTSARANNSPSFSTTSKALAEQVTELVQSLGGIATIHTHVSEEYRESYQVKIRLHVNPFRLQRKAEQWDSIVRKHAIQRKMVSIKKTRVAQARCILVSGESHRYITDGMVVTHNTNIPGLHSAMEDVIPKLKIHYAVWSDDILKKFYESQHVLLAPSRGEGKNMPALEMQSTGGAVIATNWGGHTQWLSSEYAYPLDYTLSPVDPEHPDTLNARASVDHLKKLMLHAYQNRDEVRRKGELASQIIPKLCSWDSVVERLLLQLKENTKHGEKLWAAAQACRLDRSDDD